MANRRLTNERDALAAALAGRYELEGEIGRGGMATVYRARDLRHDRYVAVKVLDRDLAAVIGADRFLSEIRITAGLQHPNVLPLFDSGHAGELLYYVMPFVDGESLRARLDREKQLPVEDAVRIATAIAHAAEYAHAHGIVHRDLKPGNILLQSGQPIVMDFGLALAVSNAAGPRITQTGVSPGTPQYMSPEQATGARNVDLRSDVYSIGAIAYEMLVGLPPHVGATSQTVLAMIASERPRRVRDSRPAVPEHVDAAIAHALEKLPADRFSSAKAFADALQQRTPVPRSRRERRSIRARAALFASIATVIAIVVGIAWSRSANRPDLPPIWLKINAPPGASFSTANGRQVALSADGGSVAFASVDGRIFVQQFAGLQPKTFSKTNAQAPELHFSPDGKSLAYWEHGPHTISVATADSTVVPAKLTAVDVLGVIVSFGSDLVYYVKDAIWSISATGGTPRALVTMDKTVDDRWTRPVMLPDGKTVALCVRPRGDSTFHLALLALASGKRTVFDVPAHDVIGYVDGMLAYLQAGRLTGIRFDVDHKKLLGNPVQLLPDVLLAPSTVTIGADGTLAYFTPAPTQSRIEIVDASGTVVDTLIAGRVKSRAVPSPDGRRVAYSANKGSQPEIWVYDVASRVTRQLTHESADQPSWTRDGKRIAFTSRGVRPLWVAEDGSGIAEAIPGVSTLKPAASEMTISRDGKYAIAIDLGQIGGGARGYALAVPLHGGEPKPILADAEAPHAPDVSPDGKWIAYESRRTGRHEVYVSPFPTGSGSVQVSDAGGDDPQWSADGRTLFYRHDNDFQAAALGFTGRIPQPTRRYPLFEKRNHIEDRISTFSVHPDGKHFIVTHPLGEPVTLVVVKNWMTEARAKLMSR